MMTYGTLRWRAWVLDEEQSRPFIRHALEQGFNFFDSADVYSLGVSEEVTGRALRDFAKRDMSYQANNFATLERVKAQAPCAWMLHKPGITAPIVGASKMDQLDEALAALKIQLSAEEIASLEAPYQPHPIPGHE